MLKANTQLNSCSFLVKWSFIGITALILVLFSNKMTSAASLDHKPNLSEGTVFSNEAINVETDKANVYIKSTDDLTDINRSDETEKQSNQDETHENNFSDDANHVTQQKEEDIIKNESPSEKQPDNNEQNDITEELQPEIEGDSSVNQDDDISNELEDKDEISENDEYKDDNELSTVDQCLDKITDANASEVMNENADCEKAFDSDPDDVIAEYADKSCENDSSKNINETNEDVVEEGKSSPCNTVFVEENPESDKEKVKEDKTDSEDKKRPATYSMMSANSTSTVLKKGDRNNRLIDIKHKLNWLGYGKISATNYFGDFMEKKVKQFQKQHRIEATGVMDLTTELKLSTLFQSTFSLNGRHNKVKDLKHNLNKIGFGKISVTNLYGSFTRTQVRKFQKHYGLIVTGHADVATLRKAEEIANSPYQLNKRNNKLITFKKQLNWTGYGNISETNLYGSFTRTQVRKFQRDNKLPISGIIDPITEEKLSSMFTNMYGPDARHEKITDIKVMLNNLGFGNISVTDLYGSFTAKKVKDFQKYYGLTASGNIDIATLTKLIDNANTPYQKGKRHSSTEDLKRKLNKIGFGNISITTLYGDFTIKKVKEFQKYYGLKTNGIVDDVTLNKVNEIINSPLQKGKRNDQLLGIKRQLNSIGYGKISVTTLFGDFMEKKIKQFQSENSLPVSGIIDPITEKEIFNFKVNNANTVRVFIDAGHGGSDPGASGNGLFEKHLTLQIAKVIEKQLGSKYKNVEIKMSRSTDNYLTLEERTDMANAWNADFYFSVHINSFTSGSANGFESFIHNKNATAEDKRVQEIIHNNIINNISEYDRGKKSSNFHVLRESKMTAMLAEYLFISNISDANKLKDQKYIDKLGNLTAEGIAKAFGLQRK